MKNQATPSFVRLFSIFLCAVLMAPVAWADNMPAPVVSVPAPAGDAPGGTTTNTHTVQHCSGQDCTTTSDTVAKTAGSAAGGCKTVPDDDKATQSCSSAFSTCNMISPQNAALIQQALNSAKSVATTTNATDAVTMDKSAATSCKIGAAMSAVAGAATLALAIACETKVSACKSANKPDKNASSSSWYSDGEDPKATNLKVCGALDTNWAMDGLQFLSYAASTAQNLECAKYYSAAAADAMPKSCAEEPTRPDCICVINPNDPSCLGQTGGLASTGFSDSSLRGNTNSADDSLNDLGTGAVAGSGGTPGASLPGAPAGGGGGPSLLGGKSNPDQPDAPGTGPYNTNVISGTTSGGPGGSLARGISSEGDSSNSSLLAALANKLNLKKYLPGNSAPNRDGLTGINGPSIWDKVSNQYGRKKAEMVP